MLSYQSTGEEVYYLKLEALWILTNLAMSDSINVMKILASQSNLTKVELQCDMDHGQSPILVCLNQLIMEKLDHKNEKLDIKTLNLVF